MKAVRIHENGNVDVLSYEEAPRPEPGSGEVLVKIHAAGVNYIDTYHRSGLYPLPLPTGLGLEAAGVVAAVGEGVDLAVVMSDEAAEEGDSEE